MKLPAKFWVGVGLIFGAQGLSLLLPAQTRSEPLFKIGRRQKVPQSAEVSVIEAIVDKSLVAGAPYYTLSGVLENRSSSIIMSASFFYEIYQADTDRLLEAGTVVLDPPVLGSGAKTAFSKLVNAEGVVRITLVQWMTGDRTRMKNLQMERFDSKSPISQDKLSLGFRSIEVQ